MPGENDHLSFNPDFAAGSPRRVLNHTRAKLLNNFSYTNLLSVRFFMHCKKVVVVFVALFYVHPTGGSKKKACLILLDMGKCGETLVKKRPFASFPDHREIFQFFLFVN